MCFCLPHTRSINALYSGIVVTKIAVNAVPNFDRANVIPPRFIATEEAQASDVYKQAIVDGTSDDVVYSNFFSGVYGNYLKTSIRNAGLDPENLPANEEKTMNFSTGQAGKPKVWKDIWGSGHGIGAIDQVLSTKQFVNKLHSEYVAARGRLGLASTLVGAARDC